MQRSAANYRLTNKISLCVCVFFFFSFPLGVMTVTVDLENEEEPQGEQNYFAGNEEFVIK